MNLRARYGALPYFWKLYLFIVAVLISIVTATEFFFEPAVEYFLLGDTDFSIDWYEFPAWIIGISIPSLLFGYWFSKKISGKVEAVSGAAKSFSHGNLGIRLPVTEGSRDEFDALAQTFNDMAEAIERQLHNERRLLADISHELRSPLARMALAVELLPRKHDEAERALVNRRLEKEIVRMDAIIATLLAQARERSGGGSGPVDVGLLLAEVVGDCRFWAKGGRKDIRADVERGLIVQGGAVMLQSMLSNILSNAVAHAPPGTSIDVAARSEACDILITIRDYGPGVPESELDDIFRPFYRVTGSSEHSRDGAGLGLALAQETILSHGGTVGARNMSPGLELSITLPAADEI